MRTTVIDRLTALFGPAAKRRKKAWSWQPRVDAGLAVQIDSPISGQHALIWLPHPGPNVPVPSNAVEYSGNEGRHSCGHSLPGLEQGRPVLLFKVETPAQLENFLQFAKTLPPVSRAL